MIQLIWVILAVAIVLSAVLWGVNRLAPEPFRTWITVIIVVVAALYVASWLLGSGSFIPFERLHR